MTNSLEDEVQRIVASMDNEEQHDQEQEPEPEETIHIHYFPDAIVIVKEDEKPAQIVDSAPVTPQKVSFLPAYAICFLFLSLICSTLAFQVYLILNPPIATVTIIPTSRHVTLSGMVQLGRLIRPITISQSQTIATTGRGHQNARAATGTVTFYNGQLNSIFVPAGLILTGSDGAQIITDQDANIPAANLPQVGQVIVSAHAINPGVRGNIAAYDINQGCCYTAIKVVNTTSFYGGVDARDFQTVTKADITIASTPLKSTVLQSMTGAFQAQLKTNEQLFLLPCSPIVTPNRNVGDEAIQVKVSVSETCSAIAYNTNALEEKVAALLTSQAQSKLAGYSLFGDILIKVNQASISNTAPHLVFLSFHAQGEWIYGLSYQSQEQIKELIAGKTTDQAARILAALPGVERGSISFHGITDITRLPKNIKYIYITLVVM